MKFTIKQHLLIREARRAKRKAEALEMAVDTPSVRAKYKAIRRYDRAVAALNKTYQDRWTVVAVRPTDVLFRDKADGEFVTIS